MAYKNVDMTDGFHVVGKYGYQITKVGKKLYIAVVYNWFPYGCGTKAVVLNNYGVRAIKQTLCKWINLNS